MFFRPSVLKRLHRRVMAERALTAQVWTGHLSAHAALVVAPDVA